MIVANVGLQEGGQPEGVLENRGKEYPIVEDEVEPGSVPVGRRPAIDIGGIDRGLLRVLFEHLIPEIGRLLKSVVEDVLLNGGFCEDAGVARGLIDEAVRVQVNHGVANLVEGVCETVSVDDALVVDLELLLEHLLCEVGDKVARVAKANQVKGGKLEFGVEGEKICDEFHIVVSRLGGGFEVAIGVGEAGVERLVDEENGGEVVPALWVLGEGVVLALFCD